MLSYKSSFCVKIGFSFHNIYDAVLVIIGFTYTEASKN